MSLKYLLSRNDIPEDARNVIRNEIIEREKVEDTLIKSEEKYQELLHGSPDAIAIYSEQKIVFANNSFVELMRAKNADTLIGKSVIEFVHPEFREFVKERMIAAAKTKKTLPLAEEKFICFDGTEIDVEVKTIPVIYQKKSSTMVIVYDITKRKRADESIRLSEQMFRSFTENSFDMICLLNISGDYTYVNPSYKIILGYGPKDLIGRNIFEICHPEDKGKMRELFINSLNAKIEKLNFICRFININGKTRWIDHRVSLLINSENQFYQILVIASDITDRKQAEDSLEESRTMLNRIIDTIPQSIFWKDAESKYLGCNRVFANTIGLSDPKEIIGKTDYDMPWPKNEADAYRADDIEVMEKNSPKFHIIEPLQKKDGTRLWIDTSKVPLLDKNGKSFGILGIYEDISERKRAEEGLRASESKYQELYTLLRLMSDTTPDLLWVKDLNKKFIFANKAVCQKLFYGEDTSEIIGKDDYYYANRERSAHPEDPNWHTFAEQCVNSDEITLREMKELQFNEYGNIGGKFIFLDVRKSPLFNKDNTLIGIVGSAQDITDQKEIEKALRESEEKFFKVFNRSPYPMMIIDMNDGRFVDVNESLVRNLEFTKGELIGKNAIELGLVEPESEHRLKKLLASNSSFSNIETIIKTKSGKQRFGLAAGDIIDINKHKYILQAIADLTEYKLTNESLRKRELLLDAAARIGQLLLTEKNIQRALNETIQIIGCASGQDRSYIFERDSHISDANCFMSLRYEWNNDGIVSQINSPELQNIPFSEVATYSYNRLNNGLNVYGNIRDFPDTERTVLEAQHIVSILLVPIKIMDQLWGFIGFDNCKTEYEWSSGEQDTLKVVAAAIGSAIERQKAEENLRYSNNQLAITLAKLEETQQQVLQQEKMRSLGQLASGIAHDINNSLTPIMGYVDLLTDDKEIMKRNEYSINMIIKSTKNIARTIGRLKEFYKMKLVDEDLIEININKIITSTLELTKHKWKNIAEATGSIIEINLDLDMSLPLILVDESEMIEALTNIILNACDAMPKGGKLTFKTYQKDEKIFIHITDTGIGMNKETLARCLDPFFTTKGEKGTGLGLAMVYGVIERHNGIIEIESEIKIGTKISIILPIVKEISKDKNIDDETEIKKSLNILLVEDDLSINNMLKKMLENKGHKIYQANNGHSAMDLYNKLIGENVKFDLVITDLGMPGIDGYSLTNGLKQITPEMPVILLTGWGAFIDKEDYPLINCVLKKPIQREELFRAINSLFITN